MKLELHIDLKPGVFAGRDFAEAVQELHKLLGSGTEVHFTGIREGSTIIETQVDLKQISKARQRMVLAGRVDDDMRRHFERLNGIFARAGTSAKLQEIRRSGPITRLEFPGANNIQPSMPSIRDHVTVQGRLFRIEGKDKSIHAGIDDGGVLYRLVLTLEQAKRAAECLFRTVRAEGTAPMTRDTNGRWQVGEVEVSSIDALDDTPLTATITELRSSGGLGWSDDPSVFSALFGRQA